tara:strand:- start:7264 stop:12051 length:4788 start_codon:yes stop_codon:yes gene_type:complete
MSDLCYPNIINKDIKVVDYINKNKFIFSKSDVKTKTHKHIKEYIYADDSLLTVSHKISSYCTKYNKDGRYIYMWYLDSKEKISILFNYDKNIDIPTLDIDYEFVYRNGTIKYKEMDNNTNILFENIETDTIYFMHLYDYYKLNGISSGKTYDSESFPSELPNYDLFVNGIIKKYWPFVEDILIKDKKDDNIQNILNNNSKLMDVVESIDKSDYTCDTFIYHFVKINILDNISNTVNIIKLFAEISLDDNVPFIKLVLDDYSDSYFKLYKPSVVNKKIINKNLLNRWIKDYNKNNILGFNKFVFSNNVVVIKKYLEIKNELYYYSIMIDYKGQVDLIIDNHDLLYITNDTLNIIFKDYNKYIKNFKSYFVKNPILDDSVLKNNNSKTRVEYINCAIIYKMKNFVNKSKKSQFLKNSIMNFFKNMTPYTRIIDEKYMYINDKDSIYLRYKRVNNYNSNDTISSIISSLSNPRLNLSRNDIISKLVDIFSISQIQADNEYDKWISIKKENILENKKVHTIIADEPGVEMNIFNKNNVDMLFELNDISSFSELNRIIRFIYSFTKLYQKFLKKDKKSSVYFEQHSKKKMQTMKSMNIDNDDVILGLDDILMNDTYKTIRDDSTKDSNISMDEIIGIDDLLSYISSSSDDSSIGFNLSGDLTNTMSGGSSSLTGGSSPKSEYNISRYYIKRLTDSSRDPKLFDFEPLIVSPSGNKYTYTRICDSTSKRQPIVLDDSELENINESYDIGSGPDSYSNVLTTGVDKKLHYICPRYWDISRNISMDPNNPNWTKEERDSEIIPYKQNSGKTTRTVLDRSSKLWGENRDVSDIYVDFLDDKRYRADGVLMPCCFGKKAQKKGNESDYISSVTPAKKDSYSQPYESFKIFFNQDDNYLSLEKKSGVSKNSTELIVKEKTKKFKTKSIEESKAKYDEIAINLKLNINMLRYLNRPKNTDRLPFGFIKFGIIQDNLSFITSVSKCLQIDSKNIINNLTTNLKIETYQKLGKIVNYFKKEYNELTNEQIESFCLWVNNYKGKLTENIDKIKIYKDSDEFIKYLNKVKDKFVCYLFELYVSWMNYRNFIDSDDFKDDHYVLPLLEIIYNKNIIVLEHINNDIKLKIPLNKFIPKDSEYIVILKRSSYYEPLFYRTYWPKKTFKENITKGIDLTEFKPELEILSNTNPNPDKKALFILQNFLGTLQNIISTKTSELYTILSKLKSNNIIINGFIIDSYNQVSHLVNDKNKLFPINPQCIINNTDYELYYSLDNFDTHSFDESLSFIQECNNILSISTAINGIILNKNKIINIVVNDNYIPIKPTINKTKYDILGNIDLREIEKKIIHNKTVDDRYIFNDFFGFENNLNQLFNNTIITYLKTREQIEKHMEVLDISNFTIDITYNLSVVNIDINSKIYNIYNKSDIGGIKGTVYKKMKLKSPDEKLYPNWGKIYVKYNYLEEINNILIDPIRLPNYKKKQLYLIIKSITDKIITVEKMDPNIYIENKLCFMDDLDCTYPCKSTKSVCKLRIHDVSYDGSDLLNKFIWKLIDLFLINKNDIENILSYKIEPYELKKTTKPDEVFFTYNDYLNNFIDLITVYNNKYIRNINIY